MDGLIVADNGNQVINSERQLILNKKMRGITPHHLHQGHLFGALMIQVMVLPYSLNFYFLEGQFQECFRHRKHF